MNESKLFRQSFFIALIMVAFLWLVKLLEWSLSVDFSFLGVYPRTPKGLLGIFSAPWIHGDVSHLVSNSVPLLLLTMGLFFFYRPIATTVFAIVYFSTGLWVWAIGRPAFHIGASGIVYGLVSFLFFMGLLRRDAPSLAISLAVTFLYHGLFAGLFPFSEKVSWESHALGGLSGFLSAVYYRRHPALAKLDSRAAGSDEELTETQNTGHVRYEGESDEGRKNGQGSMGVFTKMGGSSAEEEGNRNDDIISLN